MNKVVNLNLVYEEPEEEGEVDMCKAMEDYTKKTEILASIKTMRSLGIAPEKIIEQVSALFDTLPCFHGRPVTGDIL